MYSDYYDYTEENNTWTGTTAQYFAVGYNKYNFESLSADIFTNSNIVINKSIGSSLRTTPGFPHRDLRTSMPEILVSSDILISSYKDIEDGVVDGSVIIAPLVNYLPVTTLIMGEPFTTPDNLKLLSNYFTSLGSVVKYRSSNHWVDTLPSVGNPVPTPQPPVFIYYFLTVRSSSSEPVFQLTGADYPDYLDFVNLGIVPPNNQELIFSQDTNVPGYVSGSVNRVNNVVTVMWSFEGRPYETADIGDITYISGRAEIWSTTNRYGVIPASRRTYYANCCRPEDDLYTGSFTFVGGNPADRSYNAVLQSNGYYKSEFNIALPFGAAQQNGNFFFKSVISPFSVPPAETIIINNPFTC